MKKFIKNKRQLGFIQSELGFSLIETLVGIALFVLIFSGIFGLINLSFKLVGQSKARTAATALANQQIELARNLPYDQVGTIGGIPPGTIPENATTTINGVLYAVKTTVTYIDDPLDGLAQNDPGPWDYKRIKVRASWSGFMGGQVELMSDVAPKGIESDADGGIISILIFDASGVPIPQAAVHIENPSAEPPIDANYQTNSQGRLYVPGAPACGACYKITAAKDDYSIDRTYAAGEIVRGVALAEPAKPHLSVLDGLMSEVSLSIDRLASQTVQIQRYVEEKIWSDSFDDAAKIEELYQTTASTTASAIFLGASEPGQFYPSGYVISTPIEATNLYAWNRVNWSPVTDASTQIKVHLFYATSTFWQLIPDADLTIGGIRNSDGFTESPLDISGLNTDKYFSLKLKADLSTSIASSTPSLLDWQVTWLSSGQTPIANQPFSMQGAKTLGNDSAGSPIYKYESNFATSANGQVIIENLEWDSYAITINPASGYDLADSLPPQPLVLNPGANQTAVLKLNAHQSHTLLTTIKNAAGAALSGATTRLYRPGYDKTKISSASGQTFFSPLSAADYTLEIEMAGYQDWSSGVTVNGQTEQIVILNEP